MWKRESLYFTVLVKRLLIVLALFMLCRFIFFLFNRDLFPELGFSDLLLASLMGLRYDLAAILIINAFFILFHIVPNPWRSGKGYQKFLKWQFYLVNGGFLLLEAADFIYYRYGSVRTSSHLLGLRYDIVHLIPQFALDFWYLLLLMVALFFIIEIFYRKTSIRIQHRPVSALIIMGSTLLLAFGLAPVLVNANSIVKGEGKTGSQLHQANEWPLITNTTFTVIESFVDRYVSPVAYFSNEEAEAIYPIRKKMHDFTPLMEAFNRPGKVNVVVILLESFSSEYIGFFNNGKGYTPFLDSLLEHSLVFTNAYANGKHSIDAITSVTTGLPPLMHDPFISSPYARNEISGMGDYLKPLGYGTYFFHGARKNTMQMDKFLPKVGFDRFYGMEEYGNRADYDDNWGIYDGPFLQFATDVLDTLPQPFAAVMFTLSSHHPFTVPDGFQSHLPPDTDPLLQTIAYSDQSLRDFFKKASESEWFNQSVFIITADHTGPALRDDYKTGTGIFDIPIAIYNPSVGSGLISEKVVQQSDILPTVLELAHYEGPYISIGDPLLSNTKGFSISYLNGIYQIIQTDYVLLFDGKKTLGLYDYHQDPFLEEDLSAHFPKEKAQLEGKLKSIIQQYINAMLENKLAVSL